LLAAIELPASNTEVMVARVDAFLFRPTRSTRWPSA